MTIQIASNTLVFPRCGLTFGDLAATVKRCGTRKVTAAKLGVSDTQLDRVIQKHGLEYLFIKQRKPGELFNGITAADLLRAASRSPNMRSAAKEFGLSESTFTKKVKQIGATDYFKRQKVRKRKVSKRAIVQLAKQGFLRSDVAYMLGISSAYLKDLIKLWNLPEEFTLKKGKAAYIAKVGYCQ